MSLFKPASETAMKDIIMLIHGPPGAGKTHLAATVSKQFPSEFPPSRPVTLTDVAFISVDSGALDGLNAQGVDVQYSVNYMDVRAECNGTNQALGKIVKEVFVLRQFPGAP